MKKFGIQLLLGFVVGCVQPEREKELTLNGDSVNLESDSDLVISQVQSQPISNDFLQLVTYIDSAGFIYDSVRFASTYQWVEQRRTFNVDKYLFYNLKIEETDLWRDHISRWDTDYSEEVINTHKLWVERWKLDTSNFRDIKVINAYFFIEKEYFDKKYPPTYYDGIIEEWTFTDSINAIQVANELSKKESMVYFNRGAYVCHLSNRMYVFHSRSAGFYDPLKKFVNYFVEKHHAVMPNKNMQRKIY